MEFLGCDIVVTMEVSSGRGAAFLGVECVAMVGAKHD